MFRIGPQRILATCFRSIKKDAKRINCSLRPTTSFSLLSHQKQSSITYRNMENKHFSRLENLPVDLSQNLSSSFTPLSGHHFRTRPRLLPRSLRLSQSFSTLTFSLPMPPLMDSATIRIPQHLPADRARTMGRRVNYHMLS